jgi:2-polyprenyl-6-methoxyphenol hydroxylase-like FAD-dependent oxidoreductase
MNSTLETSVLIVGAGPVGLTLAIDLGWRGIDCIVIDQQASADTVLPRAAGLTSRTMEFFRRWGIVDEVAKAGFPQDYALDIVYCTSLCGHELEREPYAALGGREAPAFTPQDRHRTPQKFLDPVLEKVATRYDKVRLIRQRRLECFEESDNGVTAHVRHIDGGRRHNFSGENVDRVFIGAPAAGSDKGDLTTIKARYMVACDGVDSGVRNALNIPLDGTPVINYTVSMLLRSPWLQRKHKMGEAERYMLVGPDGIWGNLTVVDGRDDWRLSLSGSAQKLDLPNLDTDAIVRRCLGSDDIPFEVHAVSPWRRREVVANRLQQGRIFLAGDAAHAMSPTGGFGMNTGIADSVDLGWKLDAVLNGWGGQSLLDSYHDDRKPAADRMVKAATDLFKPWALKLDYKAILDDTEEGERTRKNVGDTLKRELFAEWEIAGTSMGYRYDASRVVVNDGTPPPPDEPMTYIQTSRPGSRAPHAWLADGRSTLDLFGQGFVLLAFGGDASATRALENTALALNVPFKVERIGDPEIARLYERRYVLVRPDGHTAWRGDEVPADARGLLDKVRGATPA